MTTTSLRDLSEGLGASGRFDARPRPELPRRFRRLGGEAAAAKGAQRALVKARRAPHRASERPHPAGAPDQKNLRFPALGQQTTPAS